MRPASVRECEQKLDAMKPDKVLPPDPDEQNEDRSDWAKTSLAVFMVTTGTDPENAVCDLLADLRHFCDRHGLDWQTELVRAMQHYTDETLDHEDEDRDEQDPARN